MSEGPSYRYCPVALIDYLKSHEVEMNNKKHLDLGGGAK